MYVIPKNISTLILHSFLLTKVIASNRLWSSDHIIDLTVAIVFCFVFRKTSHSQEILNVVMPDVSEEEKYACAHVACDAGREQYPMLAKQDGLRLPQGRQSEYTTTWHRHQAVPPPGGAVVYHRTLQSLEGATNPGTVRTLQHTVEHIYESPTSDRRSPSDDSSVDGGPFYHQLDPDGHETNVPTDKSKFAPQRQHTCP